MVKAALCRSLLSTWAVCTVEARTVDLLSGTRHAPRHCESDLHHLRRPLACSMQTCKLARLLDPNLQCRLDPWLLPTSTARMLVRHLFLEFWRSLAPSSKPCYAKVALDPRRPHGCRESLHAFRCVATLSKIWRRPREVCVPFCGILNLVSKQLLP